MNMTLGTAVLLLALAVAGIVLVYKFLRKKPKLRIACIVLLSLIAQKLYGNGYDVAIEMIAGMGMTVGQEVLDSCVWIGRFWQTVLWQTGYGPTRIFRREEKLDLCGSLSAKDANIRQALVDRYAPGQPNFGKGTKKDPGFFYGFSADMWAAMAVATTYFDKYIKGVKL